jgi:glucose-6-phosphate 1-epimerase
MSDRETKHGRVAPDSTANIEVTQASTLESMNLQELTDHFAIPGVLAFEESEHGLIRATVTTLSCSAELYLHGAHLTHWQPAGREPVLFLSERSAFAADKAIRGGVPIIFPWFGPRTATPESPRTDGPSHGFARVSSWSVAFAALAGEDLHLTLTLGPNEMSRELDYDNFQLAYQVVLGKELRLRLTVANQGEKPLRFEEALHTYLQVGDAKQVQIEGLANTEFLDKTDHFLRKTQIEQVLRLTGETDRPYLNTTAPVRLVDPAWQRAITVSKANSHTTVVWNPWSTLSAKLADMTPENWTSMTCIETANVAENAIVLQAREAHTMEAHFMVEELEG